jgi:hypothetical protein
LHDELTGLTVIPGAGVDDPEVMFEEHAVGKIAATSNC